MLEKILSVFKKEKEKEKYTFEKSLDINDSLLTRISPDSIEEHKDYIRSGSNYTRTLIAFDFNPFIRQEDIMKLNELSENITVVQYLDVYDASKVESELSKSMRQNRNKIMDNRLPEHIKSDAEAQYESAKILLDSLARNKQRMFMFQYLIHIVGSSLEELDSLTSTVKAQASYAKIIYPVRKAKEAFDSFLPIGKNKVYDLTYRPMDTEAVSYFFPFHEHEVYEDKGIVYGKNISTGNIIKQNDEELLNKHMYITGISGSGKSTFMFTNMMRKYMFGNRILVIDPKREFGKPFEVMGGSWVRFGLDEDSAVINPFDVPVSSVLVDDDDDSKIEATSSLYDQISTLIIMFCLIYDKMTDLQQDVLSQILIDFYKKNGITKETNFAKLKPHDFPIMKQFHDYLGSLQDKDPKKFELLEEFYETLHAYSHGLYSSMFNGHTNVDIDNQLISFDIFSVYRNDRVRKVIYFLLLSHIRNEILNGDKKPTQVYIDEAHLIADPKVVVAMEYLYEMMKVVRSFNCGITPATQSITDFLSAKTEYRNYGEAVIFQSVQQIYLPMSRKEVSFINDEMGFQFSEEDLDFLEMKKGKKTEQQGKGFYFVGSQKVKMEVFMTEFEKKLWIDKDYEFIKKKMKEKVG